MRRLVRITDSDFFGGAPAYLDSVSRYGARGVLLDGRSNVGMMYMSASDLFKLPGGGVDKGEDPRDAFVREILEETGFEAEIMHELGWAEEHKIRNRFMQYSYCYLARALRNTGKTMLSANERKLGMTIAWLTPSEASEAMRNAVLRTDDYSKRFMLMRDRAILEHAMKLID
jgi:ADP-ribose pyrophosphatase YjhB (NUDIX family)